MKVTPQMMTKLEKCKSAEDVLELAKKENVSLTLEQAKNAFELLQSEDISDETMKKVTGGSGNCDKSNHECSALLSNCPCVPLFREL